MKPHPAQGKKRFYTNGFVPTPRETRVSYRTHRRTESARVPYIWFRTDTKRDEGFVPHPQADGLGKGSVQRVLHRHPQGPGFRNASTYGRTVKDFCTLM